MPPKTSKPKKAPVRSVNIFDMLKRIDRHDTEYYRDLCEADQKQLHPLVLQRWLSGSSDPVVLQLLNGTVNNYIFSLADHKELLMQMLLITSCGQSRRYKWIPKSKKVIHNPSMISIVQEYFGCSLREATLYIPRYSVDDLKEMALAVGRQEADIKQIFK